MPDRWTQWWRARVPEPARTRAFDPALADLERDWAGDSTRHGAIARRGDVVRLALQCRQVAAVDRVDGIGRRMFEGALMQFHDIRLALRRLRRQPAFSVSVTLTLALGIGANLAVAAYVFGLLLAPVNAPDPQELVRVIRGSVTGATTDIVSWPLYVDVRDGLSGVDLAAHVTTTAQVGGASATEMRAVELVSGNYFRVLRQTPLLGRLVDDRDVTAPLASPVVVLSESYWQRRFDGDPAIVGRSVLVNGSAFNVIGVAAEQFSGTYQAYAIDLWAPVTMQAWVRPRGQEMANRNWGWLRMIGRRRAGVSIDQTQAAADAVAASVNRQHPPAEEVQALVLLASDAAALTGRDRETLSPMLAASAAFTALLFLVTCANLAGVMQARFAARRRELAIRQSLGAAGRRLLSEWLTECLVIALAGGTIGWLAARAMVLGLGGLELPHQLVGNLSLATAVDWRLSLCAAGLSLVAACVFGLLPAWRARRLTPAEGLRSETSTSTGGRSAVRLRRAAVVVQLTLSGVLLLSAALLARSLINQQRFDPGFETAHLGLIRVNYTSHRVPEADWRRLTVAALDRIRQDPDVIAADIGASVPLGFTDDARGFRIQGYTPPGDRDFVIVDFNVVGARYFAALGVPFVRGGPWNADQALGTPAGIVINETMARTYWEGRDPIGESVEVLPGRMVRVAGIVADAAYYDVGEEAMPYVYLPAEVAPLGDGYLHVRTEGDPAQTVARLRSALEAVDPGLASAEVLTFEQMRRIPLFPARLMASAALVFGGLAALLACVGLYGVVTMSVSQRTREIGLRMALGARPSTVLTGVLREAMALTLAGLTLAFGGGYLAAGVLRVWLFQVARVDPVASIVVVLLLTMLALVAAWLPARRAASIDPVVALRAG